MMVVRVVRRLGRPRLLLFPAAVTLAVLLTVSMVGWTQNRLPQWKSLPSSSSSSSLSPCVPASASGDQAAADVSTSNSLAHSPAAYSRAMLEPDAKVSTTGGCPSVPLYRSTIDTMDTYAKLNFQVTFPYFSCIFISINYVNYDTKRFNVYNLIIPRIEHNFI